MTQVERESALPDDQQYASSLSPPLFLALALLLVHKVSTALGQTDTIVAESHGLAGLVNDNASALALRVIISPASPLLLAARLVRNRKIKLDRASLRQPFYARCYPAAIFALSISIGASLGVDQHHWKRVAGLRLVAESVIDFWAIETLWFARTLAIGELRAAGNVSLRILEKALFLLFVAFLFSR